MKVLLTGAAGFVGSHLLDRLRQENLPTRLLLRPESNTRFLTPHLAATEISRGSLLEASALAVALEDVTHVIHCAGATRARTPADYYRANEEGTRSLVEAVNRRPAQIERFLHISSLAAGHPATPAAPAREEDPPGPVSHYGRSKLAAEQAITGACSAPFTILRPPAVYGPRDEAFLDLFKAVRRHLLPAFGGGRQPLSLVYVRDLAEAVLVGLRHPATAGRTYYVASPQVVTARELGEEIAAHLRVRTWPLRLPLACLWPVCAAAELVGRWSGKATLLNRQKYAELKAPGWVCDPGRLRRETGFAATTTLSEGVAQTLAWYQREGWL